jgi:hypothetical protein
MLRRSIGAIVGYVAFLTIAQSVADRANAVDLSGYELPVLVGYEDHAYDTQVFGGLKWNFGDMTPEVELGVRRVVTRQDDDAFGGKADLAFKITPNFWETPTFRLMGDAGKRDALGEFGLGLSGLDFKPLIAAGVQGPYVDGGANYVFGKGLDPYIGATSLGPPKSPRDGTLYCPYGNYHLEAASSAQFPPPSPGEILMGQTCHL